MDLTTLNMTEDQFINHEIRVWGFDHIEKLLDDGYEPVLTNRGWTWLYTNTDSKESIAIDALPLAA